MFFTMDKFFFFFCKSINKNVLEWFILVTVKNIPWRDLQTFLEETIPRYVFDQLRRGQQVSNTKLLTLWLEV